LIQYKFKAAKNKKDESENKLTSSMLLAKKRHSTYTYKSNYIYLSHRNIDAFGSATLTTHK